MVFMSREKLRYIFNVALKVVFVVHMWSKHPGHRREVAQRDGLQLKDVSKVSALSL